MTVETQKRYQEGTHPVCPFKKLIARISYLREYSDFKASEANYSHTYVRVPSRSWYIIHCLCLEKNT